MQWLIVPGYEEYSVSENGQIYSHKRKKCLSPKTDRYGYKVVALRKGGKSKHITVHRIVALAFIPNPHNYPCVNHLNEIKIDNCVKNLEWCTVKQNNNHGTRNERMSKTKSKHPVIRILNTGEIIVYKGVKDAFRKTGIAHSQITKFCKNKNIEDWRFLDE